MKTSSLKTTAIFSLAVVVLITISSNCIAQSKYHGTGLNLTVSGTSTLHDWEMTTNKGQAEALITVEDHSIAFSGLSLVVPAISLKSGHDLMDKNTYKALNSDKNPNISFILSSANLVPMGANTYMFKGVGRLTIAGKTQQTDLIGTVKYNPADKSFFCTGIKKFKMTEYGVKPPTVMMGTIKTGDDIAISYALTIKS